MKISLCAIVKNEALVIGRMIDSAADVVDEIIIVDTGSSDKTVEVIHEHSSKHPGLIRFHTMEWVNDFSVARNFSLDFATGDWIVVVDADEFLDDGEKLDLRPFLENTEADGVLVTQRNYTGRMNDISHVVDVDVCRIFRRGYLYEGAIHEQIVPGIKSAGGSFAKFPLHLHHVGYTVEYQKYKGRSNRNISLLKEQSKTVSQQKDKEYRWFNRSNLIAEYSQLGRWEDVASEARLTIEEIKKTKRERWPNFVPRIYKFLMNGLRYSGKLDDALRMSKEACVFFPKDTDLLFMQGEIQTMREDYRTALQLFQKCREFGDVRSSLVEYTEGAGSYLAARNIASIWLTLGDPLSAREWFVKALSENTELSGLIPWIVLLTPDVEVCRALERSIRTPQRHDEFIQFYALTANSDALTFIERSESEWGVRDTTRRARFAYTVRQGQEPVLGGNPAEGDFVRQGLWFYEQGNISEAKNCWKTGGQAGHYLIHVVEKCSSNYMWSVKDIFMELLSARSLRFLHDFAPYTNDLHVIFNYVLHSDALAAFYDDSFMRMSGHSSQEWEWKAQVALAQGKPTMAHRMLGKAVLKDGKYSVRGTTILAQLDVENRESILKRALETYPDSLLLSHVWLENFATSTILS